MKEKRNISFSPPDITEEDIREVVDVLRSGWITTGPRVKEFERNISLYCHTDRKDENGDSLPSTACFNSATSGLEMTLRALGIGSGDEVILPAYTYTATASAVIHAGAVPILIDCKKESYEMDYELVKKAINPNTKAIIPVELGGILCDYDIVFDILNESKSLFRARNAIQERFGRIQVISDAAHALGATRKGKKCGEIADFTIFSFHAVKNLTTAEGGAVTWKKHEDIDDRKLYRKFQLLSLHGQDRDALAKIQGGWEYDIVAPYYKCNMTDIMAAMGLSQLRRYDEILLRRKKLIERYDSALAGLNISTARHYEAHHSSSGHLYLVRILKADAEMRNLVVEKMREKGISTNVHYKPLPMFTAYKKLGYDIKDFPNSYAQFRNEITLPLYTRLTEDDVDYIVDNFKSVLSAL